ncbi:DUF6751 family protein [Anaerocolumna chitinilytica]|uniref:Uncharacterized protein n=1 Tax=Anaerocolumna chitinilytica TaxID=1727145 RepID=A0A7M3SAI4_9FIRM|nr:DUF6751 family protein [Anaerocolumna chitinilytica]BCK01602.1 hypothetical protein bsdcttw_46420 [Anaerocolumna chitinilytica]
MFTNTDITLYKIDSQGHYTRKPIIGITSAYGSFWDDVKQSNVLKTGMLTVDSVSIFIPIGNIPAGVNDFTTGKDLIAKGAINFEVDNTSQSTISSSLKTLQLTNRVVTVSVADDKRYGSPDMQHWELSCK